MKYILLIACLLFTTAAICQSKIFRADKIVEYQKTETILLSDNLVYKYTTDTITARFFEPGADKYEVTMTFKKIVEIGMPTIKIEAESATSIVNAQIFNGTLICCMVPTTTLKYPDPKLTTHRKVKVRYARGDGGNGLMTLTIGTVSYPLTFESTGGWANWREKDFVIGSGTGEVVFTSSQRGAANLDWFQFEQ